MDAAFLLDEVQLRVILKKVHKGDAEARAKYDALIKEASDKGDEFRVLYLFYMREVVLREKLEVYAKELLILPPTYQYTPPPLKSG